MFKRKIRRPSNSEIKKRRIIKALALSMAFFAILSITYTLTNININTKRLKGDSSASYCDESSSCYQAGFRDFNFYKEVIDIYGQLPHCHARHFSAAVPIPVFSRRYPL